MPHKRIMTVSQHNFKSVLCYST